MRNTNLYQYLNLLSKEQLKSSQPISDDKKIVDNNNKITPDDSTLGMILAYAVSTIPRRESPASLALSVRNIYHTDDMKKNFQKTCRNIFQEAAQKYQLNGHTAAKLESEYLPLVASLPAQEKVDYFAEGSLEKMVLQLTQKGKFEELGQALKEGAQEYNKISEKKHQPYFRFAAEYNAIQKALSEKIKGL